jgi:hypothetical protein
MSETSSGIVDCVFDSLAEDRDERPWYLLAVRRADGLEAKIQERRAFVIDQLQRADAALEAGRPNEAVAIRAMLSESTLNMPTSPTCWAQLPGPNRRAPGQQPIQHHPLLQARLQRPTPLDSQPERERTLNRRVINPTARRAVTPPRPTPSKTLLNAVLHECLHE